MVIGDRFLGADMLIEWVELMDAVAISVEYRLAPESPEPAPVEAGNPAMDASVCRVSGSWRSGVKPASGSGVFRYRRNGSAPIGPLPDPGAPAGPTI